MIIRSMLIVLGLTLSFPSQAAMKDADGKTIILKDCDALEMTKAENQTRDLLIQYMKEVYDLTEENIRLKKILSRTRTGKKYVSPQ